LTVPLLDPADPLAPKYWAYDTGGQLAVAVMTYLRNDPLSPADIALLRSYLLQWIASPVWDQPAYSREGALALNQLRVDVRAIRSGEQLRTWLWMALEIGIDLHLIYRLLLVRLKLSSSRLTASWSRLLRVMPILRAWASRAARMSVCRRKQVVIPLFSPGFALTGSSLTCSILLGVGQGQPGISFPIVVMHCK
jgi:hypothetical protein